MPTTFKVNNDMITSKRHADILEMVREQGYVSVEKMAHRFAVTPQTIRRDINQLGNEGFLRRYHGGAGITSSTENLAYKTRQILCQAEKSRIARLLTEHIPDKSSIFINIGTTTEEVAKHLSNKKELRVITNNLHVAATLFDHDNIDVIVAGGPVRSRDGGITGDATIDFINQFKVDYGIIGISGIDNDGTLLDFDYNEVRVAKTIIANSRNVYLAADHSKFERNAMVCLCHLSEITALFTDQLPPADILEILNNSNVSLHVAE